jgi:hypothetical protein
LGLPSFQVAHIEECVEKEAYIGLDAEQEVVNVDQANIICQMIFFKVWVI